MAVELADDRAIFLADFGVTATYTPSFGAEKSITVIFDNEYLDVDVGGSVAFATQQPKILARDGDISGMKEGDVITISNVDYTIRVVMPDGTGMTEIMLEKDPWHT